MSTYDEFAFLYDELMNQVPYEEWIEFIISEFLANIKPIRLVCELGCGTGNITLPLAKRGYEMIGIDFSENMLMIAREKAYEENLNILFLLQDMREFELYGTVDAIISVCDSCNYIDSTGLKSVFKLVANYLENEGLFIFDLNTRYKFESIYANQTFTEIGEDYAIIWENQFDPSSGCNEYNLTGFIENPEVSAYERFEEVHQEYTYDHQSVLNWIENSGLCVIAAYDNYTKEPAHELSERITYVITKK